MVKTSSTMLPLGSPLPFFDLPIVKGKQKTRNTWLDNRDRLNSNIFDTKPVLLMVLCAHCPFVKHLEGELTRLDTDFRDYVHIIAIGSNCLETHPQDGPENLADQITRNKWTFPYLLDLNQDLAKSLRAACTPDFFLFAASDQSEKKLVYRGQFDDSRPGNSISPSGSNLREALEAVLNFRKVSTNQKPSLGCNIKWIPGAEPLWFG